MKKRFLSLFLSCAVVCGVLCGCGDASNSASGSGASDEKTSSQAAGSDSIVVGIAQDLDSSLDPYTITAAGTREVLFNVFEGLIKVDSSGNFNPAVAETYTVSDDQLTYTFTLRSGVKFHNGDTVTIDDVIYSYNTCAAKTEDAALSAALSNAKISAVSDNVAEIRLTKADPNFISYLAYVTIAPDDYTEQATKPVGTGPFKFTSRSVQENVILDRNDDYYGEKAYLKRVTYRVFEDTSAMITALDAGTIDLCAHLSVDQIAGLPKDYTVLEGTMNLVQALYLNNANAPFDNEKVRQALCYAIDIQEIMDLTEDGHGTKVGSAMYPSFTKYFDPALADTYSYNPEKAKELLKEAGYPNGFSFSITVPSNYTPHVNTAEVIVDQLSRVGIKAKLEPVEWATWLSDVYGDRNYESTVVGFDASTLTAAAMLARYQSTASNNMFNYSNADFDKTYQEAAACTDDAEATGLYKQCLKILADTAANVYLQDLAEFVVIRSSLTGYEFYPMYIMDMSTIRYK